VKRKGGRVVTYQSLDSVLIFLTVLSLQSEQSDFPFSFFAMLVHRSLSLFESPHRAYKRLVLKYCAVGYNGVLRESSRLRRLVATLERRVGEETSRPRSTCLVAAATHTSTIPSHS
jgi:hypothetical protein